MLNNMQANFENWLYNHGTWYIQRCNNPQHNIPFYKRSRQQTNRIEITSVLSMQAQSSLFTYISPLQTLEVLEFSFCHFFFSCYLTHTPRVIISVTVKRRMRFSVMFFLPVQLQVYQSRKLMLHFGFIVSELFSRNILYRVGKSTRKSFQKW